jgi:hypothetical protein
MPDTDKSHSGIEQQLDPAGPASAVSAVEAQVPCQNKALLRALSRVREQRDPNSLSAHSTHHSHHRKS